MRIGDGVLVQAGWLLGTMIIDHATGETATESEALAS